MVIARYLRPLALAFAFVLALPGPARASDPPPLEAYGALPDIERVALSRSGERLAAVMTIGGERALLLLTSELDTLRIARLDDAKVRSIDWVGEDNVVVTISRTETLGPEYVTDQVEFWHAIILPTDKSKPEETVFAGNATMLNAVFGDYGVREVDGRWLAFFSGVEKERGARGYYIGNGRPALFAVDVARNRYERVAPAASEGQGASWLVGADGEVAVTFSMDYARGSWQVKVPYGPIVAEGIAPRGDAGLIALGKDGDTVIYAALDEEEGRTIWYEVALDGEKRPKRYAAAEEIERVYTDRDTGHLIGITRTGDDEIPDFISPEQQAVAVKIQQAFGDFNVRMADWTPDFSRVLVRTTGNGDSGTWYLVDMAELKASAIGYEREAIGPEHVGAVSTFEYTAQDGLALSGILTLPPGREGKNLPLVMLPHGGPHAHDGETFDWWAQAFASRGYAVFQPNFRGSTNQDEAFMRAGFGQWGRAMQTDISDGLAALAEQGIVDPERACIMGASYGGYAALAGVTLQQGLYRCAVAVAPVSHLGSLFSDEYNYFRRGGLLRRSLLEELGPRSGFDEVSPRSFASKADAPILLIHGRDDTVVPFDQSENMADALRNARKPYKMVVLREEDHWLSRANTRLQMLQEAMAFVLEHNPPD